MGTLLAGALFVCRLCPFVAVLYGELKLFSAVSSCCAVASQGCASPLLH